MQAKKQFRMLTLRESANFSHSSRSSFVLKGKLERTLIFASLACTMPPINALLSLKAAINVMQLKVHLCAFLV